MQEQVGVQPGDPAISVQEGVCPRQPMVCSSQGDDGSFPSPNAAVHLLPTLDESGQRLRCRRLVPADRHTALAKLAGHQGAAIGQQIGRAHV